MVRLVDSHAHLNARDYDHDREAVVEAALETLACVIDVGTDFETAQTSLALSRAFDRVYSTVGVSPHRARAHDESSLRPLLNLVHGPKVVAIGEIGLDYHYDFSPREDQRRVFAWQVEQAVRLAKPVVVHVREAFDDALAILREGGSPRGVLHCFTGTRDQARRALDAGLYLSFSGMVTFKNADAMREVVAGVPTDRLLLETDSPYLTPHPHRNQKRNVPTMVEFTARVVARTMSIGEPELAALTTANACHLFGLPAPAEGMA